MWLLWYISFIHNFAAKELKWMQLSILYPCGWNFIPFDKIRKKNCKSVKKEKLKFGSTQMKVYFGIPYKKCKYSWWWRLLPGGLGWSPVAYILKAQIYIYIFRHARCICKTMWLFNMTPPDLPHLPTSDQSFQGATYKGQWQGNQRHGLGLGYPGGVPVFWERPGSFRNPCTSFLVFRWYVLRVV